MQPRETHSIWKMGTEPLGLGQWIEKKPIIESFECDPPFGIVNTGNPVSSFTFAVKISEKSSVIDTLQISALPDEILNVYEDVRPGETIITTDSNTLMSGSRSWRVDAISATGEATITGTVDVMSTVFIGTVYNDAPSAAQIFQLERLIVMAGNLSHTFVLNDAEARACAVIPADWGELIEIRTIDDTDIIDEFSKTTINRRTTSGLVIPCNVWLQNTPGQEPDKELTLFLLRTN